ncbi:uncharacterized protein LOC100204948 isoform X1 [Hydra vulgaris]|uniref:uncharacterized protein LOC100204948 isoform X1 n=1 Tax=Hydra vulgaris TaxID=6087 RepID=UPI001F5E8409|nr:ras-like GTP-binding protein YPT1 [Hydra vulgaris]XP_047132318.1 ras-like GTP-binding protein YPT1 [Hydra vulgaris]XP_047132319.1 ras-like GTP-binding protein YPT1 [Hydra vulgaris]XP_047132321.1 ras-like GTP-binding protein YPT1 [Hydra vulgaris]
MSVANRHSKNYDYLFKIILIGDSGVGKTSLLAKFVDEEVVQSHISTIGIDFKMRCLVISGKQVKVQIWDTAGQERYETITTQYYRRAHGIILTYDVTRHDSFVNVRKWLRYVEEFADGNVKLVLLGNKSDLTDARKVTKVEAQALAEEFKIQWFETSAYTGENVEDAFLMITRQIYVDVLRSEEDSKITEELKGNLTSFPTLEKDSPKCTC